MNNIMFPLFSIVLMAFCSCNSNKDQEPQALPDVKYTKESMMRVNQRLKRTETAEIESYARHHQWPVITTQSGIRYWIYGAGKGSALKAGSTVKLKYKLSLINGVECYNSDKDGLWSFEIGKCEVSGFNEMSLLLKTGDKAKVIIPSHLGYGLMGDQKSIPSKATLIYDIEVLAN